MNAKKLKSAAAWLLIAAVAVCAALPACSKRTADGGGGTETPATEASMTEALATDMPVTEVPTTEAPVNVGPVFTEIKVYRSPAEGYEMRLALSPEQEERRCASFPAANGSLPAFRRKATTASSLTGSIAAIVPHPEC